MRKALRRMTSPTTRTIGTIWIIVLAVSGLVLHGSIRQYDCDKQFHAALIDRAGTTDQVFQFDKEERQALADWIHDFATPPPEAGSYGPARMGWLAGVSQRAIARFNVIASERDATLAARKPLPEITCGT
jgi:hypothetical protein